MALFKKRITKALIRLRRCADWPAPVLFANPRRQVFSRRGPNVTNVLISGHKTAKTLIKLRRQIYNVDNSKHVRKIGVAGLLYK